MKQMTMRCRCSSLISMVSYFSMSLFSLFVQASYSQDKNDRPIPQNCSELGKPSDEINENTTVSTPENPDVVLEYWQPKKKKFIVVSATKTASESADLDFAKVNGDFIAEKLKLIGYEPLEIITDVNATRDHFVNALQEIHAPENGLVIVYYTGHGVTDDKDLWLQLYGTDIGAKHGLSVTDLVSAAREIYEGDLIIIVDSCFSGRAALNTLSSMEVRNTIFITSSTESQKSAIMKLPDETDASAFSYFFIEAITSDWNNSDEDHDGILEYQELVDYVEQRLICAHFEGKIDIQMTPMFHQKSKERIFAYNQAKARNWNSGIRKLFRIRALEKEAIHVLRNREKEGFAASSIVTPISQRAIELASIINENEDSYVRGLKAIAQGRFDDAIDILREAEKKKDNDLEKIYLTLGLAQRYANKYEDAIDSYDNGLKINDNNQEILHEKAIALLETKDYKHSLNAFLKSIQLQASNLSTSPSEINDLVVAYKAELVKANRSKEVIKLNDHADKILASVSQ